MMTTSFLNDEHLLVESYGIKNWSLIPKEKIEAFRKISYTGRQLFYSPYFQDFSQELKPFLTQETGLCAPGLEMFIRLIKERDYLEPHFPFELDLREIYQKQIQFYSELLKNCGKMEYLVFLERTPPEANPWIVEEKMDWWDEYKTTINLRKIPYFRKTSDMFTSDYEPEYLKHYNENRKKK